MACVFLGEAQQYLSQRISFHVFHVPGLWVLLERCQLQIWKLAKGKDYYLNKIHISSFPCAAYDKLEQAKHPIGAAHGKGRD